MPNERGSDTPDRNDKVVLREPGFRYPGQRPPELEFIPHIIGQPRPRFSVLEVTVADPRGKTKSHVEEDHENDEKLSARNYRSIGYSGRRREERCSDKEDDEEEYRKLRRQRDDRQNSRKYSEARENDGRHRQDRHRQSSRDYSEDRRRRDSEASPPSLHNQSSRRGRENRDSEGQRHRNDEHYENNRVQLKKTHIYCHECNLHLGCVAFPDRPEYGREFRKCAEYYCTECAEETQNLNGGGDYEAPRRRQKDDRSRQNDQDSARSGQSSRRRSSDRRDYERRRHDHWDDSEGHRHQDDQYSSRYYQSSQRRSPDRRDNFRNGSGENYEHNRLISGKEVGRKVIFSEVLERICAILWNSALFWQRKDRLCQLLLTPAIHEACLRVDNAIHADAQWQMRLDQVIEFNRQHPGRENRLEVWKNTLNQMRFGKREDNYTTLLPSKAVMYMERMVQASASSHD